MVIPMSENIDDFANLERALTRLIRRAFLPTAGEATRREAGINLERAAYATLVRVGRLEEGRLSDIAAELGVDVSTTSRHVRRLVDAGYVDVHSDPDDARARRYTLSDAGHDALERVRRARRAHLARILDDWASHDVATLAAGLDRLVTAFETHERETT